MDRVELEIDIPEPFDLGEFSYQFIDLANLFAKLAYIAQRKYDSLYAIKTKGMSV